MIATGVNTEREKLMRTIARFGISAILVVLLSSSAGAEVISAGCQTAQVESIRLTLDELAKGIGNNDLHALEVLWSDDYQYVRKDGVVLDKRKRIERVRTGIARHDLVRYEDPRIRCYGDTAVVMTQTVSRSEGQKTGSPLQVTHVLVHAKPRWQVVMTHATSVAEVPID
jgi:ketosteroid isomerase-like protein